MQRFVTSVHRRGVTRADVGPKLRATRRNSSAFSKSPVLHNSPAMAPRLSRRLARTFLVVSPLVLAALASTPVPTTPTTEADEANGPVEILVRTVPDANATLTFPPAPAGRRARPTLSIEGTDQTDPNTGFNVARASRPAPTSSRSRGRPCGSCSTDR